MSDEITRQWQLGVYYVAKLRGHQPTIDNMRAKLGDIDDLDMAAMQAYRTAPDWMKESIQRIVRHNAGKFTSAELEAMERGNHGD